MARLVLAVIGGASGVWLSRRRLREDPALSRRRRLLAFDILRAGGLAYLVAAFVEMIVIKLDYYPDDGPIITAGILVSLAGYILALPLVVLAFARRLGTQIEAVSTFFLLAGLPFIGMQIVSDLNRGLDRGNTVVVTRQISGCSDKTGGSGKSRSTSYSLSLSTGADSRVPDQIFVTRALCNAAHDNDTVVVEISPGLLGVAWYRSVRIGDEVLNTR